ncbi:hypothetical protein EC957_007798 [Mortierella hygrophila]|uniref:TPX2 C-terminal domain-containing protein n=1 Tax=Mortierella hygrophila TaxID=979708 RepID=A0A9P6EY36_9FUNG|nr:hypothetical protein EC957_007798 [Mortierella hygrophila]
MNEQREATFFNPTTFKTSTRTGATSNLRTEHHTRLATLNPSNTSSDTYISMQRTLSTATTSTKGRPGLTATIPSRARTAATANTTKGATEAGATFNIGSTTTTATTLRPRHTQPTRSSALTGLLSSKKTLVSLSTLAAAKVSTTISTAGPNPYRFSFGDASDNPFLEQPPRELFKDVAPTDTSSTQQPPREAASKPQEPNGPQGLVLTRVLPINSPARISAAASTQAPRDSSTTNKLLPKDDYDNFLSRSTSQRHNPDAAEEPDRDAGGMSDILKKSLRMTAMDIARKSIMHHADASPRKTFLKVSEVAARSHGELSLHDLLAATEKKDDGESMLSRPAKAETTHSFGHPDTPFTFESTPLPPLNLTTASQEPRVRHGIEESEHTISTHDKHAAALDAVDSDTTHDRVANRTAPYKVLSVNERETMRSSRVTGFRARPVDSKVFTMAGEFGVPRIVKLPLTKPVSPVFSKRVRSKTTATETVAVLKSTTTTTKSSLPSGPVRTTAFQRLVNTTKPNQRKDADRGRQANGPNDGKGTVDTDKKTRQSSTASAVPPRSGDNANSHTTSSLLPVSSAPLAPPVQETATTIYPSTTTAQKPLSIGSSSLFRPPAMNLFRKTTLGPPLRGNGPSATTAPVTAAPPVARIPEKTSSGAPPVAHSRKPATQPVPFKFATDELRKDGHGTAATSATVEPAPSRAAERTTSGRSTAAPIPHARRPLTQPVPFKFATDDILRRRHIMFQSRGHSKSAAPVTSTASAVKEKARPVNSGVFKRPRPLKRLTTPVPFRLATEHRAEVRPPATRHTHTHESAALASIRTPPRRSRLAGVFPVPTGHPFMTSSIHVERPFMPTVPVSPKFGRRVPVPSLRPTHFVLRKSTKELTQPHEFQFHSDQRAKEREEYERQQAEREERMRMRESLERTFRARPIAHYQPTVIHKAKRPLTKPVSPMIGEKRKRYEMEQQHLEQQREEEEYREPQQHLQQLEYSQDRRDGHHDDSPFISSPTRGSVPDAEVYRSFEEAKILQAQQQALQQQLTEQERRQVVLANSARATIHQPPIRLSFPMDPETEALQEAEDFQTGDHHHEEVSRDHEESSSSTVLAAAPMASRSHPQPLPPVRDSFGGSNNHRLSRELRRISLESRRTSGERGIRSRLSDNFSRRSASSAGSRKSDGEAVGTQQYYAFTRSQERTSAPSTTTLGGVRTTTAATMATTAPATNITTSSAPFSEMASTASVVTPAPLPTRTPTTTTTTTATTTTATTAATTTSSAPVTTYRPAVVSEQGKDERRRRSGSFIPLEPAVKPATASPSKSSRLSRLFGAPPVSAATTTYADVKDSFAARAASTASAAASSLSRSKGPVVIEHSHTLTLSDL